MNSSRLLHLNPQLCVRQHGRDLWTVLRDWRPLPVSRDSTVHEVWSATAPTGGGGVGGDKPRRDWAPKLLATCMALVLLGVVNVSAWGVTRVRQQRMTYQLSQQLRRSEAQSRRLTTENRNLNAWLAVSEARAISAGSVMAASAAPAKPSRRKQT